MGGKQRRGGVQQRARGAGCVVPGPSGLLGLCGCVFVCVYMRGDPQDRAWIWISIHTGSRMIVGLHPASGGSSGLTASGLDILTPLFPINHHALDIIQGS